MKKNLAFLFLISIFFFASQKANAGIPIIWSTGECLSTVEKLPSDYTIENRHVNLAIIHDQFSLFWIPMWNYGDMKYVMSTDDEKTYYALEDGELEIIEAEYNVKVSESPSLSIWKKTGGKPLILLLIGWIIWSYIPKKKEEELVTEVAPTDESLNQNMDTTNSIEVDHTKSIDTIENKENDK